MVTRAIVTARELVTERRFHVSLATVISLGRERREIHGTTGAVVVTHVIGHSTKGVKRITTQRTYQIIIVFAGSVFDLAKL